MTASRTKPDWSTIYFKDRIDPSDENFRIVELRIPRDVTHAAWRPADLTGIYARERTRRFCAAFLCGQGDLADREMEKILRKSHAIDDKLDNAS